MRRSIAAIPALLFAGTIAVILRQRRCIRALAAEARQDPLTGLPNRRQLADCWARMPDAAAVLFIDLSGFRQINLQHGHIIGDQLLRQVAGRLANVVSAPEILVRWGGDEFVAIVRARDASQRRQEFAAVLAPPFNLQTSAGPISVRIGARSSQSSGERQLAGALAAAATALPDTR